MRQRMIGWLLIALSLATSGQPRRYENEANLARRDGFFWKAWLIYLEGLAAQPDHGQLRSSAQQFAPLVGQRLEVDKPRPPRDPASLTSLQAVPALPEIVKRARDSRIVILNEEHDKSQSRVFAHRLAQELAQEGFRILAAETFSPSVYSLHEFPYPQTNSGFYTADTFFADFIRQAVGWGFRPIAYESTASSSGLSVTDSIQLREREQARNLVERVFRRYPPDAKVFIYVGYDHVTERPMALRENPQAPEVELRWMACRLAEATGLDPLTIDQTTLTERSNAGDEHPVYRALRSTHWLSDSIILKNGDGTPQVFGRYQGKVDLQVAHPPSESVRPAWMRMNGYRREVPLREEWLPRQGTGLLSAFVDGELESPVAMDRLAVTRHSQEPLLLPKGRYRLYLESPPGTLSPVGEASVP